MLSDTAPVEDLELMPDAADRILAELGVLRGQLDRLETRIERVEILGAKVAVLERQDETDRATDRRIEFRVGRLEDQARTIGRLEGLEAQVAAKRQEVAELTKLLGSRASKAVTEDLDSRLTALETDKARGEGMSKAVIVGWTALTAAPGLVGLAIALWKLSGP